MRFAASRRLGAPPADISSVRLGITLTEPWERELLTSFVRAAVASSLLRDTATNSDASAAIAWIRQHVSEAALAPLSSGVIVIDFVDAATGPWETGYEFEAGGERFRWVLEGQASRGALMRVADAGRGMFPATPSLRIWTWTSGVCRGGRSRWPACCRHLVRPGR
jgi:hypothetical protein